MKSINKLTVVSSVVLFSLIFSLVFPASVLADDATPPTPATPEVFPPSEEPVITEVPATVEPLPTGPAPTEVPVITEESPPTEVPVTEESSVSESAGAVDLARVVETAAENDLTLADARGDPLDLGTVEAAETLSAGDPYIIRNGVTYSFMPPGGCGALPNCTESTTPIQDALDFAQAGETVYVLAGVYSEKLSINTPNLTLMGDPGVLDLAGAGPNAPILDGSAFDDASDADNNGGIGITINAENFTLIGFIIQNFDTAIYKPVVAGVSNVSLQNNTIQDNKNGIDLGGAQGVPQIYINYNIFQDNSGFDLINSQGDNNIQFVDAKNNYWGCSTGPVVAIYKVIQQGKGGAPDVYGWRYIVWADGKNSTEYASNPYPNCGLLYGYDSFYDNMGQGGQYDPYKIVIDPLATPEIPGCTDPLAGNFDPNANSDDGSCTYICGDGLVNQSSEQCDDGNLTPGDGCSASCTTEIPGCTDPLAGNFDPGANYDNGSCTYICGDGLVNQISEQCDDGNLTPGDGCSASCTTEIPGCTDPLAGNFDPGANYDDGSCTYICGDGLVNQSSEQCDDGNLTPGDGCSASCTTEIPGCTDQNAGNYDPGANYDDGSCTYICGDGLVNQTSEQCDDGNLTPGDGCSATCTTEFPGCTDPNAGNYDPGANYDDGSCTYICGDGLVNQSSEQCDDGNLTPGDGCSATCTAEFPGCTDPLAGNYDPGANYDDGSCTYICGDGIVNQSSEQCDDGNLTPGDGCSATCTAEFPGCTDPNAGNYDPGANYDDGSCTYICGDGKVNQTSEQCDDGNLTPGDGCSATCTAEFPGCTDPNAGNYDPGANYDDGSCTYICGDGKVNQTSEQCDDGNLTPGDGCSASCITEIPGCTDPNAGNYNPNANFDDESCTYLCGDGKVNQPSEACDDGNFTPGDGCSSICTIEIPGCTDPSAINYNPAATVSNGSCRYFTPDVPSVAFSGLIPVTSGEPHAIAAGIAHTCALTPEGGVQCWGNNDFGQLGDGTNIGSNIPVDVVGLVGATSIVAGGNHTCVLVGRDVWCWGQNSQGQLGDGTKTDSNKPVKVLNGASGITAGLDYTCAIMVYGQVMCWGNNNKGQLADGTQTDHTTPALASLLSGITGVDAGQNKSCGLTTAGLLRCSAGDTTQEIQGFSAETGGLPATSLEVAVNRFGSLIMALTENGVPIAFQTGKFRTISDVKGGVDVDSGFGQTCVLLGDGTVKCWGSNYYGQLGNNSKTSTVDPQLVTNISSAWQLAVGKHHACVLIATNGPTDEIRCWGLNKDGQLGNGTNVNSPVPVSVLQPE